AEARKQREAEEAERKRQEEAERKRQEAEEQKRKEEEARKQREAAEQAAREQALQEQLAAEADARRSAEEQDLLKRLQAAIYGRIVRNFNKQGLPSGLECSFTVRLAPDGSLIDVAITRSSGNELFDQRALVAVRKSSPLPVPEDKEFFERNFRQFTITFRPQG
ncbi:MAG: cell envelope integrity protein TolA, partial [Gammaproteobacteria bacterium]